MKKKISLKYKIGISLLVFVVFILLMLFVFQVLLLEPMFEQSKISTIRAVADTVAQYVNDEDDLDEVIYENQTAYDTCIRVFPDLEDVYEFPEDQIGPGPNAGCILYRMKPHEAEKYIYQALYSEDQTYLAAEDEQMIMPTSNENYRNIIYTKIVETEDGKAAVMVNTGITPMNATTRTLTTQLLYISAILIAAVLALTYYLYRQIARPLSVINESAKSLPEGKYDPDSSTNRYREAEELNDTLVQAAKDIRKADQAKRDLIANVSHDLRTPLTMISGYGEMMMDLPDEKTDENIQVIVDESRRLTNLVNDLLDLSKMQEDKITLHPEVFDLTDLIRTQMRKYEVYTVNDGFQIEQNLIDGIYIEADKARLEQVFNNFMTNAINYSGEKKHIIVNQILKDGHVRVEVRDFGEGISKEDLKNIWDRYYKVDKTHVRVSSGSGIGLSIVREIMELHRAAYGAESAPNEGSTFWFEFPVIKKES